MNNDELHNQLEQFVKEAREMCQGGKVTGYIPELAKASPSTLGITIQKIGDKPISAGDCKSVFTLQSISKVFSLLLALMDHGEIKVFERVGMEPTGDDFNSMVKLEQVEPGKPFNPMINAGAIAIASMVRGYTSEVKFERLLSLIRRIAADDTIGYNHDVYRSEKMTADRNRSLGYLLKHNKIISGEVEEHLEVYFKQCSIEMTCRQVARMALVLSNHGVDPDNGEQLVPARFVQIAKVFMTTCGMYNASGEFAIRVGLPAKSGVSGGIMALVPGRMGIGVVGPALSSKGNSIAGVHLLQRLSEKWKLSIF